MAKSKLDVHKKDKIFELHFEEGFSQEKLADLYDVSQSTIHNVIKEKKHELEKNELKQMLEQAAKKGFEQAAKEHLSQNQDHMKPYGQNLLEE